jgi:PIN domain nuclease of toxin-antitoxin system
MPLENIVKSLATNTQTFQQETGASIQNLKNQISLLASSVYKIESNKGRLPSQAKINPKKNISAMILRSGKEVQIKTITTGTQ